MEDVFSTLLSTLCFRTFNSLIHIGNRSSSLLKILVSVVRFRPWAPYTNSLAFSGAFLCLEFRGWMRITDVVRPIAKQSATSAPARSPQGANRPKPVWILPPRAAISYPNNCTSFSGAFLSLEFRGWMRTTDVVRPIAKQSASSAPVRSPQGTPLSY